MKTMHEGRRRIRTAALIYLAVALHLCAAVSARADDGYRLWLR